VGCAETSLMGLSLIGERSLGAMTGGPDAIKVNLCI
jgi:hypothetical protein